MYQKSIAHGSMGIVSDLGISDIPINVGDEDYVEIAGLKIAKKNLGAKEIYDYGLYFQWGDTLGYTADLVGETEDKKYFGILDYKWADGTGNRTKNNYIKYNESDNKVILDTDDDAAYVLTGGKWRMPTNNEIILLSLGSHFTVLENYNGTGVNGIVIKDKLDRDKQIFIPMGGCLTKGKPSNKIGLHGYYWTSTLNTGVDKIVSSFYVKWAIDGTSMANVKTFRETGLMIRPILVE